MISEQGNGSGNASGNKAGSSFHPRRGCRRLDAKERSRAPHCNLITQHKAPLPPSAPKTQRRHSHACKDHHPRHRLRDVPGRIPRCLGSSAARQVHRKPRRRWRGHGGWHRDDRRRRDHHRRRGLLRPARHLMDAGLGGPG